MKILRVGYPPASAPSACADAELLYLSPPPPFPYCMRQRGEEEVLYIQTEGGVRVIPSPTCPDR